MNSRKTILVSAMIASDPWQGGATWAALQYILGFLQLGYEVYFIEPISPQALRPAGAGLASSENVSYFRQVTEQFDLTDRSALLLHGTRETVGLPYDRLRQVALQSQLLLNVSGMLDDPALMEPIPIRAYLDLDPAFNQLWSSVQQIDMRFSGHTHFVTIGQAIGEPHCLVPACGLNWLKTWPPIVLDRWPKVEGRAHYGLTTIGNWRAYGSIEFQGMKFGQKAHSLRPFFALPTLTSETFSLALAIHREETSDWEALRSFGWQVLDPAQAAPTPSHYQHFIRNSAAEFGIAKSGYVISQCGWMSDRSLCYLASGRPVLAQDTGFRPYLPTEDGGLLPFRDIPDVLSAIESLRSNYARHAVRARDLAWEYFDSNKVLSRLLTNLGI